MREIGWVVLVVVVMSLVFPNIYAQQSTDPCGTSKFDCYQELGFRLDSDPVICMNTPSDPSLITKLQGYTIAGVQEWSSLLNAGGTSRIPKWNIQLISSTASDVCNITIDYLPKPLPSETQASIIDPIGVTYPYTDHTAKIEIFYDQVEFKTIYCADQSCKTQVDPSVANYVMSVPYYTDSFAPDYQMYWTIRHELGHAFGLDHYILTDYEDQMWSSGHFNAPSIMVEGIPHEGVYTATITPMDITQLESLYNNNGFGGHTKTTLPSRQSSPTQQISIETDKQVYYYGDHVTVTINVSQVTGANATLTLTKSGSQTEGVPIPIAISELQTSITSPYALNETNSFTGTIDVHLSYDGQTASTSFQIIGQPTSSVTSQDQTNSNVPTTITPVPSEVKSNAYYWARGDIGNDAFVKVLQWLAFENDISIQQSSQEPNSQTVIPSWVKKDAKLWYQGDMTDSEFSAVIQYLLDNKIIVLTQ